MATYLGKSCSFGLPRVPFVNCRQFMYLVISLLVLRAGCGIWLCQFLIIAYLFTLIIRHNWFYKDKDKNKRICKKLKQMKHFGQFRFIEYVCSYTMRHAKETIFAKQSSKRSSWLKLYSQFHEITPSGHASGFAKLRVKFQFAKLIRVISATCGILVLWHCILDRDRAKSGGKRVIKLVVIREVVSCASVSLLALTQWLKPRLHALTSPNKKVSHDENQW